MIGIVDLPNSGGSKINGIVEEYVAKGNISAGGFVKFANNYNMNVSEDAEISSSSYSGETISAVVLDENRVFIAHGCNNAYLYGVVCTISNNTITVGTDTQISANSHSGYTISAIKLSNNKVFITHTYFVSSSDLYGIICSIEGDIITANTDTKITGSIHKYDHSISAVALDENRVFIAYTDNSNKYLHAKVCTINNNIISTGTSKRIYGTSTDCHTYPISAVLLGDKVFIAYSTTTSSYGVVCTISGSTITVGTAVKINQHSILNDCISAVSLLANKVVVTYEGRNNDIYYLYAVICIIDNTTITVGTETELDGSNHGISAISIVLLSKDIVFIGYSCDDNLYLYGISCKINNDNTITAGNGMLINSNEHSGYEISAVKISNNKLFIAHPYISGNRILYGTIINLTDLVQTATKQDTVFGVAKNKALDGQAVKVVRPIYNESEEN